MVFFQIFMVFLGDLDRLHPHVVVQLLKFVKALLNSIFAHVLF